MPRARYGSGGEMMEWLKDPAVFQNVRCLACILVVGVFAIVLALRAKDL